MKKECFKCTKIKPLSAFYEHPRMRDGYLNKCKACARNDTINNRSKNINYYLEYDKNRANLPHRVKQRKEYAANNPDIVGAIKSRWRKKNKHKANASLKVSRAIKRGLIHKLPCVVCFKKIAQAHHPDYTKPLEIIWLCPQHHKDVHHGKLFIKDGEVLK